jgi:hypothetical protein
VLLPSEFVPVLSTADKVPKSSEELAVSSLVGKLVYRTSEFRIEAVFPMYGFAVTRKLNGLASISAGTIPDSALLAKLAGNN